MLDIRIVQKEGYDAKSDGTNFVILDVNITEELKNEGILRDIIRQCQLFRKEAGFNVEDRINIKFESDNTELLNMLNNNKDIISSELLAKFDEIVSYEFSKDIVDDYTLNVKMNRIQIKSNLGLFLHQKLKIAYNNIKILCGKYVVNILTITKKYDII